MIFKTRKAAQADRRRLTPHWRAQINIIKFFSTQDGAYRYVHQLKG